MARHFNPQLIRALHEWGAYRRDEDITGTGYGPETMEFKMMKGTAWSSGGQMIEPDYEPSPTALAVSRIVNRLPAKLNNVLWASYVGKTGPMGDDRGSKALGVSLYEYRDLHASALARVADALGWALYTWSEDEKFRAK